jgi:hypothetical protein
MPPRSSRAGVTSHRALGKVSVLMALISAASRGLELASQVAIDVRDARAMAERARAAEEAREAADQLAAQRSIEDEVTLLDARRRAALQEQLEAEQARVADLASSPSYPRPGLSVRYETTNPVTPPEQAALASTTAFASPQVQAAQLGEWAAVAAYQLQVAAGTDAASSTVRVRA